jgi:hypothetical protein
MIGFICFVIGVFLIGRSIKEDKQRRRKGGRRGWQTPYLNRLRK